MSPSATQSESSSRDATRTFHADTPSPASILSTRGFDASVLVHRLVHSGYDADRFQEDLFPGLEGAALEEAARQVLALLPTELDVAVRAGIEGRLREMIPARIPREPVGEVDFDEVEVIPDHDEQPGAPDTSGQKLDAVIDSMAKGKSPEVGGPGAREWIHNHFPGLRDAEVAPLLRQLRHRAVDRPLSPEERTVVTDTLDRLRATHPATQGLEPKRLRLFDLHEKKSVSRQMATQWKSMLASRSDKEVALAEALRKATRLKPDLRWGALNWMKEALAEGDPLNAPLDEALEEAYKEAQAMRAEVGVRNRARMIAADLQLLADLADWGDDPQGHPLPALIVEGDAAASIAMWRFMLHRYADHLTEDQQQHVRAALTRLKRDKGVLTPRDQFHMQWVKEVHDEVHGFLSHPANEGAQEFLRQLRMSLGGSVATLALALDSTLKTGDVHAWPSAERLFLQRASALLITLEGKPLEAIAFPGRPIARQPQKLRRVPPVIARKRPTEAELGKYGKGLKEFEAHNALARKDATAVGKQLLTLTRFVSDADGNPRETTTAEKCDELLIACNLSPDRLIGALGRISAQGGAYAHLVANLRNEFIYSLRNDSGGNVPMRWSGYARVGTQSVLNGLREGPAHFVAFVAMRAAGNAIDLAGHPYVRAGIFGLMGAFVLPMASHWRLQKAKSPDYRANPSRTTDALLMASLAMTMVTSVGVAAGVGAARLPLMAADAFAFNNLARSIRQGLQSWTQSPLTAGLAIRHRDGSGLSAQEQYRLNIIRDSLYVVCSVALLVYGPSHAAQLIQAVIPAAATLGEQTLVAAATLLASGINEVLDGIHPDTAKVIFRGIFGDEFMLQPDTQTHPGADPTHFLDHTAARVMASGPADVLFSLAAVARSQGEERAAWALLTGAALLTGFYGAMRGRALSYLRTTESVAENGTRNPDGLLTFLAEGAGRVASAVIGAVRPAPRPLNADTELAELSKVTVEEKGPDRGAEESTQRIGSMEHDAAVDSHALIDELADVGDRHVDPLPPSDVVVDVGEGDPFPLTDVVVGGDGDPFPLTDVVVGGDGAVPETGAARLAAETPLRQERPDEPDRGLARSD